MIAVIADNIISPLGFSTQENFEAVLSGDTKIRLHESVFGLREPFCGALMDRERINQVFADTFGGTSTAYTFFEKMCILSVHYAITACGLEAWQEDTVFLLSTTKGNVDGLETDLYAEACQISGSAKKVAQFFGNVNTPIIVSNACISGVCAQIAGVRELLAGRYKYAVVVGGDVLSRFIISGFQSFKALSPECCRPYDIDRIGLNLGEATGTVILASVDHCQADTWVYEGSSVHNDANHISGPSRTGEGAYRVLSDLLQTISVEDVAFVNAHGTATPYNDEMESIALHRAGLEHVPVNGLKGYLGHTLGAAGIIETILSMRAVDHGVVLATKGFETTGTTYPLNISNAVRETTKSAFIKILSGFGGCNAGIAYKKGGF